jgi:hypothetical protein
MDRNHFLLSLPLLLLTGCGGSEIVPPRSITLDEDVVVQLSEEVLIAGEGTTLTIVSVPEDSRCSPSADCTREGLIRVLFEVRTVGGLFTQAASLPSLGASRTPPPYSGYYVVLAKAIPERGVGQTIPTREYRLTIRVTKAP